MTILRILRISVVVVTVLIGADLLSLSKEEDQDSPLAFPLFGIIWIGLLLSVPFFVVCSGIITIVPFVFTLVFFTCYLYRRWNLYQESRSYLQNE